VINIILTLRYLEVFIEPQRKLGNRQMPVPQCCTERVVPPVIWLEKKIRMTIPQTAGIARPTNVFPLVLKNIGLGQSLRNPKNRWIPKVSQKSHLFMRGSRDIATSPPRSAAKSVAMADKSEFLGQFWHSSGFLTELSRMIVVLVPSFHPKKGCFTTNKWLDLASWDMPDHWHDEFLYVLRRI